MPGCLDRDSDFAGPGRGYGYIGRRDLIDPLSKSSSATCSTSALNFKSAQCSLWHEHRRRIAFSKAARPGQGRPSAAGRRDLIRRRLEPVVTQSVQIVGPLIHHCASLGDELGSIVGSAQRA